MSSDSPLDSSLRDAMGPLEGCKHDTELSLAGLPPGSQVAVITMLGSLCPITLGHVQGFIEARKALVGDSFADAIGLIALYQDYQVASKLAATGQESLCMADRAELVSIATSELPWLGYCSRSRRVIDQLRQRWPQLAFIEYSSNGADDVLIMKYEKWQYAAPNSRFITMGRPGDTEWLDEFV